MFETHDTARVPFLTDVGEHYWSYVSVLLNFAWFHVTYVKTYEDDMNLTETIILSRVSQLIDIAKRDDVKIKFVDLVSPGYMNGSERWKMEPLREIWLCTGDEYPDQKDYVFLLECGARYKDTIPASLENEFYEDRLIFRTTPP